MDILVVEDEFLLALALEDCLTRAGHRVIGPARRRADALDCAARARPDLVLLDIRLAGGDDGVELAAELDERVGAPILYASGQTEEARDAPVGLGVLRKPYSERDLLRSVRVVERMRRGEVPREEVPEALTLFERQTA